MYIFHENQYDTDSSSIYGFFVYRKDGKSMPKGMITSFNAMWYKALDRFPSFSQIEFAVQSPTGDSSDHFDYTMPCANFEQAKAIVDNYRAGLYEMLGEIRKEELYS